MHLKNCWNLQAVKKARGYKLHVLCCAAANTWHKKNKNTKEKGCLTRQFINALMIIYGVFGIALLLRCIYNKGYFAMASWKSQGSLLIMWHTIFILKRWQCKICCVCIKREISPFIFLMWTCSSLQNTLKVTNKKRRGSYFCLNRLEGLRLVAGITF